MIRLVTGFFLLSTTYLPAADKIDFSRDVRPILTANCISCHGGVKKDGGVSFLFRKEALAKGKSGKATVVPGKPEASELMRRLTTTVPDDFMPPPDHRPALKPEEVQLIRRWIEEGAEWGDHWSFEKPQTHPAPDTKNKTWPKQKLDSFILARLEAEGNKPSAAADAHAMVRRLYFDLIGLPPSLDDIKAFKAAYKSDPDAAIATTTDKLLASSHFGERWAAPWLDLARYSDSEGLGVDRFRDMHPYRNWVIQSLNDDLPFDQFVQKQIAGDLLPNPTLEDQIATAFHRLTQTNGEGGTDDEEFRTVAVMDRVATTWEALQGLTFGCAQCHNHPYEPILHEEYYEFLAFFNNSQDADLGLHHPVLSVPKDPAHYKKANRLQKEIHQLNQTRVDTILDLTEKTAWKKIASFDKVKTNATSVETVKENGFAEFRVIGVKSRDSTYTLTFTPEDTLSSLSAIRLEILPRDLKKALHTPEWGSLVSFVRLHINVPGEKPRRIPIAALLGDDPTPSLEDQYSLDPKTPWGWGPLSKIFHPRSAVILPEAPVELPPGSTMTLDIAQNRFILGAFPLVIERGRLSYTDDASWNKWHQAEEAKAARDSLAKLKTELKKLPAIKLPVMAERPDHLSRETRFFSRGNWLTKTGPALTANVPDSLNTFKPTDPKKPTRLDLAKWLIDRDNPLTARVAVNRFWEQLFGFGIVDTLEDFGSSGNLPSHPELLDDLSVRFQTEMNWSVKNLLRELVTSATYRQSGHRINTGNDPDPRNRLLARGPRNRLSAEMARDQFLTASNLVTPDPLFRGVTYPPVPEGGYTPTASLKDWHTNPVGHADRYRRAVYTYMKRSSPYPSMQAFDAPSRESCTKRRLVSNTPLAALTALNDPLFNESAVELAKHLAKNHPEDNEAAIREGYLIVTNRPITSKKLTILTDLLRAAEKEYQAHPELTEEMKASVHEASLATITAVLLNLDEALTK